MHGTRRESWPADHHRHDQRGNHDRQLQRKERQQACAGKRQQHGLDRHADLDRELKPGHPAEPQADLERDRAAVLNHERTTMPAPAMAVPSTITVGVADEQAEEDREHQATERERQTDAEQVAQEAPSVRSRSGRVFAHGDARKSEVADGRNDRHQRRDRQ